MSGPDGVAMPRPARAELAFVTALAALVAFVYLGVTVSLAPPGPFDAGVRDAFVSAFGSDPGQAAIDALDAIGSLEGGAILTVALAGLFLGLRRFGAAAAVVSTWLADGVSSIVKELLMRPRPPGASVDSVLAESWSYPSGHVVRTMAVVAVLAWLSTSRWSWNRRTVGALGAGIAAGLMMGIARVASGAHWPTDVVGGLLLGTVYVLVAALAAEALAARRRRLSGPSAAPVRSPPPSPGPDSA